MATPAEVAAAKAKAAQQASALASAKAQQTTAQAKLATYGNQANIDFTKAVAPKFSAMSELAAKITTKAATKPELLKAQGITLDQLKEKTATVQAGATKYTTDVTGITQAEQDLATAQGLVNQYSTPINIPTQDPMSTDTRDAYALIEDTLNTYGLSELSSVIKGYMLAGLGPEQAKLQIKQDPIYKARFKGNELRLASGLNAFSEAEYLGLEDTYNQVMNQYGLGTYFGTTRTARQGKLAEVTGGDISAVELKSRISTVVDRVNNADPIIKAQLKEFYPGITETDLVKYFLDPKQTLPQLEEKVTSAEIGAAATGQGLKTSMTSASDLARYGIDRASAIKGYSTIGGILPGAQKLSDIYGEAKIDYTQATAEQEVFKGNASAERKRKQLMALETAQFSGSAGVGAAGLSTQMLRKSSSAGQY